ncbi:C40 family peptidase [Cohnella sp. CFH 77786]|uniref:C40 family peptidase n=1 Tax=Cohnella sp. CFH 77786 TaxID=2662265 RepID=UPI001C61075F|nr:SH3 domain-containing C40 family peptidase [Cohnella sp. CFH 77786]
MKKHFITLAAVGLVSLALSAVASASPATVERSVNFRSAPSTSGTVYQLLKPGTVIDVQEQVNRYWLKVSVNGKVGYLSPNYIAYTQTSPAPAPTPAPTTAPSPTPAPAAPSASKADRVIQHAMDLKGVTHYKFGVNQPPSLLDCSSFTKYVFGMEGVSLKWGTRYQKDAGTYVPKDELARGDLVFFRVGSSTEIGHVGIYLGNGQFIHNSPSFDGVGISSMTTGYWSTRYVTGRRVL